MLVTEKLDKPFEEIKNIEFIVTACDYCGKESKKQKCNYLRSRKTIERDCCDAKECKNSKTKEVNLKKYGIEYVLQSPEVQKKIKQTNIEKYGHEHPFSSLAIKEKIKQKNLEKFGFENPSQSPEIQNKRKQTNIEKYGHEHAMQSPEVQEKIRQTNLEKYGHENVFSSPEVQEKIRQTNLEKYGHEHHFSSPEVQKKIKQTCLENYGHECSLQSPDVQERIRQTNIERYGVENPLQSSEIQEKRRQTNIEKFGCENASSSPEVREKRRQTCLERFGFEYSFQSPEIQEKRRQTNLERYGSPYPIHKFGKTQKEITEWLNSFGFNFQSNHIVLNGKELDLYDENLKFAIEYSGLHWHHENSPQPRPSNYHINKFNICKEKGIQLITIFEDEWLNNQEVIKSVILSKLGVFEKRLYARKCIAKEISKKEFTDFCDKHHVQGGNSLAKVCFGLYYEDELIGVMDLGSHHRKQTKGEMVLTRLCFKAGYQIIGGASKLFTACVNWCKSNEVKKIISWSDNRWSNGSIYKNLNFVLEQELGSDYAYVNMSYPKERISKQSQMKCNTGCPKDISEKEWALQNGLSRIWDCGKVRWAFNI
jgi:hypothetical protein